MTNLKVFEWELHSSELEQLTIERHCHNCGRKVPFHDSKVRRHNANGKNIYQFAIYKCKKGHTWNKKLDIYKTFSEHIATTEFADLTIMPHKLEMLSIQQLILQQVEVIHIHLKDIIGRWRLDKLLAQQFGDMSRSQIVHSIEMSWIKVDDQSAKASAILKSGQNIQLNLAQLNHFLIDSNK